MNNKAQFGTIIFGAIFFIIAIILFIGYDYVPAGTVGVTDNLGNIGEKPLQPGVYWTGFFTSIHEMNSRIQVQNYKAAAASSDLQVVNTNVAVNFTIDPQKAPEIYRTIGEDYQSVIIYPIVQEAVKQATSKYTAEQLITKRGEAKDSITNYIVTKLETKGLIVEEVAITNFDFSSEFNAAIERKQVAEQDALTAKNKLEETRLLVEGSKLQQEILAARQLDLQQQWIAKWDGKLPQTLVMGSEDSFNLMVNPNPNTIVLNNTIRTR